MKKTREKRDKRLQELVVGTSPTKAWTREVGDRSSVQVFVGNFLNAQDGMANAHASLADALDSVATDLGKTERKEEQVRKKHTTFASRALADREKVYSDRAQSKARYDETCREVEAQRHKREKAESGDKHADRAAKAQTAAEAEMKNAKVSAASFGGIQYVGGELTVPPSLLSKQNTYLISIALANKAKDLYYKRTCVALQNVSKTMQSLISALPYPSSCLQDLQRLWSLATSRLKTRLRRANEHLLTHTDRLNASVSEIESAFTSISPVDDQRLYVEYNRRHWEAPGDWAFEPCVGFFDTAEMAVEESAARIFLQNRLLRARQRIGEVRPQIESRKKELQGLSNLRDAYEKQDGVGDPDEVMDVSQTLASAHCTFTDAHTRLPSKNLLDSSRELLVLETNEGCLLAEESVIVETIGEEHSSARPHQFKPASFTIPTSCDFCNGTIWGISKQGLVCKPCGFTVHSKCELKAPADCGVPGGASAAVIQGSAPQAKQAPAARVSAIESAGESVSDSRTVSGVSSDQHTPRGKALYGFEATSPFELTMSGECMLIESFA